MICASDFEGASVVCQSLECESWLDQVAFLGHVVSKDDIGVDPKKIEAIIEWTRPTTATKVRSFFGISKLL